MTQDIATLQKVATAAIEFLVRYSFQIIGAFIVLMVGIYVARWSGAMVVKLCRKRNLDPTISQFLGSLIRFVLLAFVFIIALGQFGISIAPFIAALGAMVFGASFAIQGPLSNYGAGLVIILTRPFMVGDTVSVQGVSGVVEEISLSTTILSAEDGEKITIPNKHVIGEIVVNSFEHKVVETVVGIAYESDVHRALEAVRTALAQFPQIAADPEPQVGIQDFGDSAVNVGLRYWVPTRTYHQTLFAVNLAVFDKLAEAGIKIPYPQREVSIRKGTFETV